MGTDVAESKRVITIKCPACGQDTEAVVRFGEVKGLCTVAHKQVLIKLD